MLTVLLCTVSVVAAVCAAIRMEAWLSTAPPVPAARGRAQTDAARRDAATAGRPAR
ncbi:hypothetical protein [Kineococcus radiotolerans]|uniref:hypothetical protein n=1 Tax=Kineococcus radiotolerans TaxID=131568 RepID=UPI00003A4C45|nr:hypothetical protein [Kineococcus radiotolerans]